MKLRLALSLLLLGDISIKVEGGGWANFLCPKDRSNSSVTFFECAKDCRNNHAAVDGKCGDFTIGDFNCYCEGRSGEVNEESLHCTAGYPLTQTWVCEEDCKCNHGAFGGTCDFELQACHCYGQKHNKDNHDCIAKTPAELADKIEYEIEEKYILPKVKVYLEAVKVWTEDDTNTFLKF